MELRRLANRLLTFPIFAIFWFFVTAVPLHAGTRSVVLEWDPSPDADVVAWNIYRSEKPADFSSRRLNNERLKTPSFRDTLQEDQTYYYAVTAIGANGMESRFSEFLEVNLRGNQRPYVSAGLDLNVIFPSFANLTATATDDGLPNAQLTYSWTVVSGSGVSLVSRDAPTAQVSFASPGVYTLRVTASDGQLSTSDDVVVNVFGASGSSNGNNVPVPVNQRPSVNAGVDQTITLPAVANLTAMATDDGLPIGRLSYWWTVVNGADVSLSSRDSGTIQASFAAPGVYTIRVTASDGQLSTDDDVVIKVQAAANQATGASAAPDYLRDSAQPASAPAARGRDDSSVAPPSTASYSATQVQNGRIYALFQGSSGTEIALGNSNSQAVAVHFNFADQAGSQLYMGDLLLGPGAKATTYQPDSPLRPISVDLSKARTFNFSASAPIDTVAFRTVASGRGEVLTTALPIADLDKPGPSVTLPFFADGGGWQSEIVLINPTDSSLSGMVRFFPSLKGSDPDFFYDLPPRSSAIFETPGTAPEIRTGWAQVVPMAGTPNPSGSLILSHEAGAVTTSLGTVFPAPPSSSYTVYVERSGNEGQPGSVQTSLAIANTNSSPATVRIQLLATNGTPTQRQGTLTIGARDKVTLTLSQIPGMAGLEPAFKGMVRIDGEAISAAALSVRYNTRGEAVITSTPAVMVSGTLP